MRALAVSLLAAGPLLAATWSLGSVSPDLPKDTLPEVLPAEPPYGLVAEELPVLSDAGVAIGRSLFFDPILSKDGSVSCASCHQPDFGFADPRTKSVGVGGARTDRNSPSLFNRALGTAFFWDGRSDSLEEQVLEPIENPKEMGLALEEAIDRLAKHEHYGPAFREAFGEEVSEALLAKVLAGFVRRLWIGDSPVDRFREGDIVHLSEAAQAGLWIYESRGFCWRCHTGQNFTDEKFHNTGIGSSVEDAAPGRFAVTGDEGDRGAFKTPTLRGLVFTAPYMHDGSLASLRDVVEFYVEGGRKNPSLSPLMEPLKLSDTDVDNLVAFLGALSAQAD